MQHRVKIEVTERDIEEGTKKQCFSCPIARAMSRVFPNVRARVSYTYVSLGCDQWGHAGYIAELPIEAHRFIERFDRTGRGKPFEFEVTL